MTRTARLLSNSLFMYHARDRDGGRNFTRTIPFDKLAAMMTRAKVEEARAAGQLVESQDKTGFYLGRTA